MNDESKEFDYSAAQDTTAAKSGAATEKSSAQLQKELERQLKSFSQTMSEGFRSGFDGRGMEIGDKAADVGNAVWELVSHEINQGLNEIKSGENLEHVVRNAASRRGGKRWWNELFGSKKNALQTCADERQGVGIAQTIVGGIFAAAFSIMGIACLAASEWTTVAAEITVLEAVGGFSTVASFPFWWLIWLGVRNLKLSGRIRNYGKVLGDKFQISLDLLAEAVQLPLTKVKKDLRRMLQKGKLSAWINESTEILYLDAKEWEASRMEKVQAAPAAGEQSVEEASDLQADVSLRTLESFIMALADEQKMMTEDPQALAELQKLRSTCAAILEWGQKHPESVPKIKRMTERYVPTTLKLLHTYNDLKLQNTDNAQNVRRDIAGMLHALNIGFSNMQEQLLEAVAMDISGDIAALQGMLARDGLSEDEISRLQKE